ncbi:monovalent cation/H(+) antiporter subunit G [Ahrensia marina]|uniref:monovalent cation/H(+) antiporter subunit G n=1 Tax=Ahrensia marina TaxID=1514904 RepID=UPI0035CFB9A8
MNGIIDILTGLIIITGAVFTLVAAMGILRFPDLYSRSHAASKAGTLGSGLLLAALALHSGELGVVTRAFAAFLFLLLTAPIAAHLLVRAAYYVGHKPWEGTQIDNLAGKYKDDGRNLRCDSFD